MRMQGFSPSEFERIAIQNGYKLVHTCGSHRKYKKDGSEYVLIFPYKHKELSRPLCKRLINEANLVF